MASRRVPILVSYKTAYAGPRIVAMAGPHRRHVVNELSERHEQWIAAVNSRDIESYAELVAEDVVWIPPVGHAIVGRQAFREWLEPFFDAYEYEFSTADHRYRAAGDWVAESGAFESRMTPATGGSAMSHVGSYLALWKRDVDGIWRIDRYVDQGPLRGD